MAEAFPRLPFNRKVAEGPASLVLSPLERTLSLYTGAYLLQIYTILHSFGPFVCIFASFCTFQAQVTDIYAPIYMYYGHKQLDNTSSCTQFGCIAKIFAQ